MHIRARAWLDGKMTESSTVYSVQDNFMSSLLSGTATSINTTKTQITLGNPGGEHILINLAAPAKKGIFTFTSKSVNPSDNFIRYTDASGTKYIIDDYYAAKLYIYRVTANHVFGRFGTPTDTDEDMTLRDQNGFKFVTLSNLMFKAKLP